jgi:hypothetical protein
MYISNFKTNISTSLHLLFLIPAPKAAELKAEVEAKVEEAIKPPPEEPPALEFMTPMPSVSAQDL